MLDYIYKLSNMFENLIESSDIDFQPETITISAGTHYLNSTYPIGPTWISEDKPIAKFASKPVAELVANRSLSLILVNSSKDMEKLAEYIDADDLEVKSLSEAIVNAGYDGWQIPHNNCADGHNILICNPEECFDIKAVTFKNL